jgi:hypothetical protein
VEGGGEVDCSAEDMVTCNKWIQHAMSVSRFVGDEGTLEKMVCSPARTTNWCSFNSAILFYFRKGWEDDSIYYMLCCVSGYVSRFNLIS